MATAALMDDLDFEQVTIAQLDAQTDGALDALPFGVIGLDAQGCADRYNATEARLAGLSPERVIGRPFFETVAQCMNNFMVAQRFDDEPDLDAVLSYVLTLRMRPTPVRLRLLQAHDMQRRYVLLQR